MYCAYSRGACLRYIVIRHERLEERALAWSASILTYVYMYCFLWRHGRRASSTWNFNLNINLT